MQTGNTLRAARNSLLCFFMALVAGFLVACGGGGGGGGDATPRGFPLYVNDSAAEGVEYSGPTGEGLTGKGGVFMADEGVFEFSIGATTLGSIRVTRDWDGSQVTPADFMDVDEQKVITIARIMQGLDEDHNPQSVGISIPQAVRGHTLDLFGLLNVRGTVAIPGVIISGEEYTIPSADDARDHLVATRKCLFSGGYVGNFEGADLADGTERRGQSYYAVEPFVNLARRFTSGGNADFESFETSTVGVIGSTITLSPGNELSFITPRLVAGEWQYPNDGTDVISSGTENLAHAANTGNPGATRRIVGVETTNTVTVAGMYVLDYFEEATVFRGRYYGVNATATNAAVSSVPLSLTIAGGGSWPAAAGMMTTLTLSGTRGESDMTITMGIVRMNDYYGEFNGVGNELSGTWCDISGATGVAVPPPQTPPAPSASARSESEIEITWSAVSGATRYYLYRSTSSDEITLIGDGISTLRYRDSGLSANTEYFYQLGACNSVGCSELLSPAVSVTTQSAAPVEPSGGGGGGGGGGGPSFNNTGTCRSFLNRPLRVGGSCTWAEVDFEVQGNGDLRASRDEGGITYSANVNLRGLSINGSPGFIFVATRSGSGSGTTWTITELE